MPEPSGPLTLPGGGPARDDVAMSTTFFGSDVAALHAMASRCAQSAEQIIDLYLRTTATLCTRLGWFGPDADAMRTRWQEEVGAGMLTVAGALREAGLRLSREAEQQLAASTDGGASPGSAASPSGRGGRGGGPAGGAAGPSAPTSTSWAERVRAVRDGLMQLPTVGMLARMAKEFPADLLPSAANDPRSVDATYAATLARASDFERRGLRALGAVGTVLDADRLVTAVEEGDLTAGVQSGTALGITALEGLGVIGAGAAASVGVSWGVGSAIGGVAYEEMQGTRYGDIVKDMATGAFEENGAAGMLQVPGILGFAAWEYFTEDPPPAAADGR